MRSLRFRRSALPSRWALIVLALCVAASMFINYRAAAQNTPPSGKAEQTPTAPAKTEPGNADASKDASKSESGTTGTPEPAAKPGQTTSKRPAASKAEDSATIEDDPTLVPDDKESADNNITFPTDI